MTPTLPTDLQMTESGPTGARTSLVLHGGGGPRTVAPLVEHLAETHRVLAPTHPGWDGTSRPADIDTVAALAAAYLDRLLGDGERDVVLIGSSIGGWIALEMAVRAAAHDRYAGVIGSVVDIGGVGAVVEGEPIADFFALDARGLAEVAWHDPDRGFVDPTALTDRQRAVQQSNGETMIAVVGRTMADPTLLGRLPIIAAPTLVVFGESDRVVTPAYGRRVAAAVPRATFAEVPDAGHLPHLENPVGTWRVLDPFLQER